VVEPLGASCAAGDETIGDDARGEPTKKRRVGRKLRAGYRREVLGIRGRARRKRVP
jgi:hypothetical protein